jgi:murein DD-endopeptidase MepM/ murein hydrolase activator NlpD
MVSCTRRHASLLLTSATLLVSVLLTLLVAAPAEGRGRPWPGHPDRRIVTHVVQPGDTATELAVRYHAWTRELIGLNHLGRDATLRAGERVRIPVVVSAAARDRRQPRSTAPPSAGAVQMRAHGWRHWRMSRAEVRHAIAREAHRRGVPARLAQAVAWQESGWHQPVRSGAGAVGVMQVLPGTGLWMSLYAHRPLDLRDTRDNITAGVTLLRVLLDETSRTRRAVAAYYQGLGAVRRHGMYPGTRRYVASVLAIRRGL